jgi:YesN/AraC family two-component response regulator
MALKQIEINKKNYTLIISDLRMPFMNGIELLKKIKKIDPSIRTVLMAAFEFDDELFQRVYRKTYH